jgi:hypothetical protein
VTERRTKEAIAVAWREYLRRREGDDEEMPPLSWKEFLLVRFDFLDTLSEEERADFDTTPPNLLDPTAS